MGQIKQVIKADGQLHRTRVSGKVYRKFKSINKRPKKSGIIGSRDAFYLTVYWNIPFVYWLEITNGKEILRAYRLGFNYANSYTRLI